TDAIVIGTWPYLHKPITLAALEAGKHVMCEARMAMNAEEARVMLEASRRHPDRIAQVVPSPFTLEIDRTVKRLLAEGFLGELLAIDIRSSDGAFFNPDAPLHWRQDMDLSGLNIMSLGIWYEVLLRWIGEATSVTARGKIAAPRRIDTETGVPKEVRIPEHLVVVAEMTGGAMATMTLSSLTGGVPVNEILLFGTEGTLRFDGDRLSGGQKSDDAFVPIEIPPHEAGAWRVEEEFIAAIRGEEPISHTTFEDGLKYMAFTEAVTQSMAEEKTMGLSL
ncbi:MAG: Gfo/Idh/MocA family oxidoreductase, partial [Verrucomicrobiota bacterium]